MPVMFCAETLAAATSAAVTIALIDIFLTSLVGEGGGREEGKLQTRLFFSQRLRGGGSIVEPWAEIARQVGPRRPSLKGRRSITRLRSHAARPSMPGAAAHSRAQDASDAFDVFASCPLPFTT